MLAGIHILSYTFVFSFGKLKTLDVLDDISKLWLDRFILLIIFVSCLHLEILIYRCNFHVRLEYSKSTAPNKSQVSLRNLSMTLRAAGTEQGDIYGWSTNLPLRYPSRK